MTALDDIDATIGLIGSVVDSQISEAELNQLHLLHNVIHRKVYCFHGNSRDRISTAGPGEYAYSPYTREISMRGKTGIACSSSCCSAKLAFIGVFPVRLGEQELPGIHINVCSVAIGTLHFPLMKCFHRFVHQSNITVKEAFDFYGKMTECGVGDSFGLHFYTHQQCLLALREPIVVTNDNVTFEGGSAVRFSQSLFDTTPWSECPSLFSKIPTVIVKMLLQTRSASAVSEMIDSKPAPDQVILHAMIRLFLRLDDESDLKTWNEMIEVCMEAPDLAELLFQIRKHIGEFMEDNLDVECDEAGITEFYYIIVPRLNYENIEMGQFEPDSC